MSVMRIFMLGLLAIPFAGIAGTQQEIDHLLAYVSATDCLYERNGKQYSGVKARDHIVKKYEYFSDKIESAEDFIQYSATKSTMSGKHYTIHCEGDEAIRSKDWLLAELKRYRAVEQLELVIGQGERR